jgi:hypothetical protein
MLELYNIQTMERITYTKCDRRFYGMPVMDNGMDVTIDGKEFTVDRVSMFTNENGDDIIRAWVFPKKKK